MATTSTRVTRSMDRKTRSESRQSGANSAGSSSSKLMKFESPEKKKRKTTAKEGGPKKKIKKEEEETDKEEEPTEEDDVAAEDDSEEKTIVIEHCLLLFSSNKQYNSFKTRANQVKEGLEEAVPGIVVTVNAVKPRRGCFEIREEGGETLISLLELDMELVIADIVEKIK